MKKSIVAVLCILLSLMLFSCSPSPAAPPSVDGSSEENSKEPDSKITLALQGPRRGKSFMVIIDGQRHRQVTDAMNRTVSYPVRSGHHSLVIQMLDGGGRVLSYIEKPDIVVPANSEWAMMYDFGSRPHPGRADLMIEPDFSEMGDPGLVKGISTSLKWTGSSDSRPMTKNSPTGYTGVIYHAVYPGTYTLTIGGYNDRGEQITLPYSSTITIKANQDDIIHPVLRSKSAVADSSLQVKVISTVADGVVDIRLYDDAMKAIPGTDGLFSNIYSGHYTVEVSITREGKLLANAVQDVYVTKRESKVISISPEVVKGTANFDFDMPSGLDVKLLIDGMAYDYHDAFFKYKLDDGTHEYSIEGIDQYGNVLRQASGSFNVSFGLNTKIEPVLTETAPTRGNLKVILHGDPRATGYRQAVLYVDGIEKASALIGGNTTSTVLSGIEAGSHELKISFSGIEKAIPFNITPLEISEIDHILEYPKYSVTVNVKPSTNTVRYNINPIGYSSVWSEPGVSSVVLDGILPGHLDLEIVGYDASENITGRAVAFVDVKEAGDNSIDCQLDESIHSVRYSVYAFEEEGVQYYDYLVMKIDDNDYRETIVRCETPEGYIKLAAGRYHQAEVDFYNANGVVVGHTWMGGFSVPETSEIRIEFNGNPAGAVFILDNPVPEYKYILNISGNQIITPTRHEYVDGKVDMHLYDAWGEVTYGPCLYWTEAIDAEGNLVAVSEKKRVVLVPEDTRVFHESMKTGGKLEVNIDNLSKIDNYVLNIRKLGEQKWTSYNYADSGLKTFDDMAPGKYELCVIGERHGYRYALSGIIPFELYPYKNLHLDVGFAINTGYVNVSVNGFLYERDDRHWSLYIKSEDGIRKIANPRTVELEAGRYEFVVKVEDDKASSGPWRELFVEAGDADINLDFEVTYQPRLTCFASSVDGYSISDNVQYEYCYQLDKDWRTLDIGPSHREEMLPKPSEIRARIYKDSSLSEYVDITPDSQNRLTYSSTTRTILNFIDVPDCDVSLSVGYKVADNLNYKTTLSIVNSTAVIEGHAMFDAESLYLYNNELGSVEIENPYIVMDKDNYINVRFPEHVSTMRFGINDTWPRPEGQNLEVERVVFQIKDDKGSCITRECTYQESQDMTMNLYRNRKYSIEATLYNSLGNVVGHGILENLSNMGKHVITIEEPVYVTTPVTIELTGLEPGLYPEQVITQGIKPFNGLIFKQDPVRKDTYVSHCELTPQDRFQGTIGLRGFPFTFPDTHYEVYPGKPAVIVVHISDLSFDTTPPTILEPVINIRTEGTPDAGSGYADAYLCGQTLKFNADIGATGIAGSFDCIWKLDGIEIGRGLVIEHSFTAADAGPHELTFTYTDRDKLYTVRRTKFRITETAYVPTEGGAV